MSIKDNNYTKSEWASLTQTLMFCCNKQNIECVQLFFCMQSAICLKIYKKKKYVHFGQVVSTTLNFSILFAYCVTSFYLWWPYQPSLGPGSPQNACIHLPLNRLYQTTTYLALFWSKKSCRVLCNHKPPSLAGVKYC